MSLIDLITQIGTFVAIIVALVQLSISIRDGRSRDQLRRREHALALYTEAVSATETSNAFHRLSGELRRAGSRQHGTVTWRLIRDEDFDAGGFFDPNDPDAEQRFSDIYTVLWFFERVRHAVDGDIADREVTFETLGFRLWWWGQLLVGLKRLTAVGAVHQLSVLAQDSARESGQLAVWVQNCSSDFAAANPVILAREASGAEGAMFDAV